MREEGGEALHVALDLLRAPGLRTALRAHALPPGVGEVLAIAAGSADSLRQASARTGYGDAELVEASRFYIQQVLLADGSDAYRSLGARRDAEQSTLRDHHRLLLRWLHPDRNVEAQWESALATRVNQAWNQLRLPEARAQYDAGLAAQAALAPAVAVATPAAAVRPKPPLPVDAPPASRVAPMAVTALGLACLALAWLAIRREDQLDDLPDLVRSPIASTPATAPAPPAAPDPGVAARAIPARDSAPASAAVPAASTASATSTPPTAAPAAPKLPSAATVPPPSAVAVAQLPPAPAPARTPAPEPAIAAAPAPAPPPTWPTSAPTRTGPSMSGHRVPDPAPILAAPSLPAPAAPPLPEPSGADAGAQAPPRTAAIVAPAPPSDPLLLMREAEATVQTLLGYLAADGAPAPGWLDARTGRRAASARQDLLARNGEPLQPRLRIDAPNWTLGADAASVHGLYRLADNGRPLEHGALYIQLTRHGSDWRVSSLQLEALR